MLLSALHEQIKSASQDILDCEVFLAAPDVVDGDDMDVYLARIDSVEIDREKNEIRLIPASGSQPSAADGPILLLSMLIEELPFDTVLWGDFEILAKLPLDRGSPGRVLKSMASVTALHIGPASGEAWFLVRPASEYRNEVLPT